MEADSNRRSTTAAHVIKIGGSLLTLPDLCERFHRWCEAQLEPRKKLVVVGGGKVIDAVRELDRIHRFESSQVHWECVRLLSNTARLAAAILGGLQVIDSPSMLQEFQSSQEAIAIVDLAGLATELSLRDALPHNWETTTDALAGYLAIKVGAGKLTLLKSASPPAFRSIDAVSQSRVGDPPQAFEQWESDTSIQQTEWLEHLSLCGFVDASIKILAPNLPPLSIVNLRSDGS